MCEPCKEYIVQGNVKLENKIIAEKEIIIEQ